MNRNHGMTVGAVLLGALMLRGGENALPPVGSGFDGGGTGSKQRHEGMVSEKAWEGPWIASCAYWAARYRFEPRPDDTTKDMEGDVNVRALGYQVHANLEPEESKGECESTAGAAPEVADRYGIREKWGVPQDTAINSVIAIVPDPLLTSMPLKFDRYVDALTNAAAYSRVDCDGKGDGASSDFMDRPYYSATYWVPWQENMAKDEQTEQKIESENATKKNRHEPGLIIFRRPVDPGRKDEAAEDSGQDNCLAARKETPTLYVFLVGETPTAGVDGLQMQKALSYRRALSAGDSKSDVYAPLFVVGPNFSGSAPSVAEALRQEAETTNAKEEIYVRGTTTSNSASNQISLALPESDKRRNFLSFGPDGEFGTETVVRMLLGAGVPWTQIAVLREEETAFGNAARRPYKTDDVPYILIHYPRNIFLLRNAYTTQNVSGKDEAMAPSPYLRLTLKGTNAFDEVPNFDQEMMPYSQEAQLMAIQRQLQRYRTQYILLSSSNVLDKLFLAQYFHRAIPDARLIFDDADLLFEREVEDVPFIGTLTVSPYHLVGMANAEHPGFGGLAMPNSDSDAFYNATAWVLCELDGRACTEDDLIGYKSVFEQPKGKTQTQPPLWVTAIGSDGYYPLGIASLKPSGPGDSPILPMAALSREGTRGYSPLPLHPSRFWEILSIVVALMCVCHAVMITVADYWSPFTRSLKIHQNEVPRKLCVYIHIGTAMLVSMALITALPEFMCHALLPWKTVDFAVAVVTVLCGLAALGTTGWQTWRLFHPDDSAPRTEDTAAPAEARDTVAAHAGGGPCSRPDSYFYNLFSGLAALALIVIPGVWWLLCGNRFAIQKASGAGLFFAYRCLNPQSGISPLVPVLFLLGTWYLWAVLHSLRHRFTIESRPLLPHYLKQTEPSMTDFPPYPLYVADSSLEREPRVTLYSNLTCLLVTREWVFRFIRQKFPSAGAKWCLRADKALMCVYLAWLLVMIFLPSMHTLDRMFWVLPDNWSAVRCIFARCPWLGFTPFEFLIRILFFPLLIVVLTSWLRMIFVWGSLRRGLLQPLENGPFRSAFDNLKGGFGWMNMFRQSGLREQWKDMSRSTESIRHIINSPGFKELEHDKIKPTAYAELDAAYRDTNASIQRLMAHIQAGTVEQRESSYMHLIERGYQTFGTLLLKHVLIEHWWKKKHGLVESEEPKTDLCEALRECLSKSNEDENDKAGQAGCGETGETGFIRVAEEFLAIRYVAMIRVVLVNLRFLMLFIVGCFVITIVAWNSYPFEPRQFINWIFTLMLFVLGTGIIIVLAQMYRDPLLSRIVNTKPNELGMEFYIRIISLGILPVLSWLAYNYPEIGSTLFKVLQPGVSVVK